MTILEIYENVCLTVPIEQRRFLDYFDDTVNELLSMYNGFVLKKNSEYLPPESLSDECNVLDLYKSAIVDNIVFLSGNDDSKKSEFVRKSRNAYLKYWNDNAKGKRIKRMRW